MMKGFATTLKSIKDNHKLLKDSDFVSKDLIHQIIEYFQHLSKLLHSGDEIEVDARSIQVNTMNTLGTKGAHYSSTAFTQHDKERQLILSKAGDAL